MCFRIKASSERPDVLAGREMTACPVRGYGPLVHTGLSCWRGWPGSHRHWRWTPLGWGQNGLVLSTPGQKELLSNLKTPPSSTGLPSSGPPGLSGGRSPSEVLDLNSRIFRVGGGCLGAAEAAHRMATEECNGIRMFMLEMAHLLKLLN